MNYKKYYIILLIFSAFVSSLVAGETHSQTDSIKTPTEAYRYIRGIVQDERPGFRPMYVLQNSLLFIPRQLSKGIKYASGYGVDLMNDPKFLYDLEPFFFNKDRSFGWYPILDITSEQRPRAGINLVMKKAPFQTILKGKYADDQKYKTEARFSYFKVHEKRILRMNLYVIYEYDDDRKYFGFGASPFSDSRNHVLSTAIDDHDVYLQEHTGVKYILGYNPGEYTSYYFTSSWDQRNIKVPKEQSQLGKIFDLSNITGMNASYYQWYNEIALRYNNYQKNHYLSEGLFGEIFMGINKGLGDTPHFSLKSGMDIFARLPVLQKNRIFTPRLSVQTMKNLSDNKIPFTEYPDHFNFRGVNNRSLLRLDHIVMVPSLQYSWPLSFNLGGHVFTDFIVAGSKWKKISMHNAPWAAGIIFDFHSPNEELANVKMIYGSEGWRFHLDIGVSIY